MCSSLVHRSAILFCVAVLLGSATTYAETIDFDDLAHGQIVDDEYTSSNGVTIFGYNRENDSGDAPGVNPHLAVAFDSTDADAASDGGDPDLVGPPASNWTGGNIDPTQSLGILLIVAERGKDNGSGFLDTAPDDQAGKGGILRFFFDQKIDSFGFSIVDIESGQAGGSNAFVSFYDGSFDSSDEVARVSFEDLESRANPPQWEGDNSANIINPLTAAELGVLPWDRVAISLNGSGAVGGINFSSPTPVIPAPAALPAGLALLTICTLRKRRKHS